MPQIFPDETPSKHYEEVILNQLVGSPLASNWTVFHSELVENSVKFGGPCEIDFVILIPECYAVICLEIKDGSFEIDGENQWCRTNYPCEQVSSPIKQAQKRQFWSPQSLFAGYGACSPRSVQISSKSYVN